MTTIQIVEQEKRRLIDLTLAGARKRLSPQTSWVHLCYEGDGSRHDTIPLYENFCFVLALFRSRLSEDILQGRQMCEKLLAFEVDGYFPVYLHEYPLVRDRGLALDILPILVHIQREFSPVLGEALEDKISALIARIIRRAEQGAERDEICSYGRHAKLLAAQGKLRLVQDRKVISSAQLGEELIALQLQGDYTDADLQMVTEFWHSGLMVYSGPYGRELQEGSAPLPTLVDFFMGQLFGNFSKRVLIDHPIQLRASLIYPFEGNVPPEKKENPIWLLDQENKALHLFWGHDGELHSFVIQGATSWKDLGNSHFIIDCPLSEVELGVGEEKAEVNCFFNYHPDHTIQIDGGRASAFRFDQELTITSSTLKIDMRFSILEEAEQGKGEFFGHLLRGNRPRQIGTRGEKRFTAYDWQIALRTVSRAKGPCTLRLHMNLSK